MPRAATTTDAFNAIAEPRRREIIELLSRGRARAVNDLVEEIGLSQSALSKHLSVLRKVGLVSVSKHGQQRHYQLDAQQLKAVHDWVKTFERFWTHQVDRIKERAELKARTRPASGPAKTN